jgi:hypothetical protein
MKFQCPEEREVATAVLSGRWPLACEPALHLHVDKCDRCASVVLVAEALRRDKAEALRAARLAHPGLLWWRAQLLRRQRAMQEVAKPISLVGGVALSVASITAIILIVAQRSQLADWLSLLTVSLPPDAFWTPAAGALSAVLLMVSAGTLGLLGCFALYLAMRRE